MHGYHNPTILTPLLSYTGSNVTPLILQEHPNFSQLFKSLTRVYCYKLSSSDAYFIGFPGNWVKFPEQLFRTLKGLSDCIGIRTHNHLVLKGTLSHLAKPFNHLASLAK